MSLISILSHKISWGETENKLKKKNEKEKSHVYQLFVAVWSIYMTNAVILSSPLKA